MTKSTDTVKSTPYQTLLKKLADMGSRLHTSINLLSAIAAITEVLVKAGNTSDAANRVLEILVRDLTDVNSCSLLLFDPDKRVLKLLSAKGQSDFLGVVDGPYNVNLTFEPGEGIAGRVFSQNEPIFWDGTTPETDMIYSAPGLTTPKSLACMPLSLSGQCLGVLNISFGSAKPFDHPRKRDLILLSGVVTNVIQTFLLKAAVLEQAVSLAAARDQLELRVKERTAELLSTNVKLRQEISHREQIEEELRRSKEEVETAYRAKSEFLATISHELRTPLNPIVGMTELALDTELNPEQTEYLDLVLQSANKLTQIIDDLIEFSQIEAGHFSQEFEAYNPKPLVKTLIADYRETAGAKGLTLAADFNVEDDKECVGDSQKILLVLSKLLDNAIKFSEKGEILISLEQTTTEDYSEAMHFRVIDHGIGIPADHLEQIFEGFSQVDSSLTRSYGGMGLGLAIARKLVNNMGGNIWVESTESEGTTFHLVIPCPVEES